MVYFFLFVLGVLVMGALFAPLRTGIVLRYAYYLRVPILFGPLFLLLLAYFGYTSPNAIQNALLTDNPIQVLVLAFEAAFLSLLFVYYREQIWIYAHERFDAPPSPFPVPDRGSGRWTGALSEISAILLAVPFIAVVIRASEAASWAPEGALARHVALLGASPQGLTLVALAGVVVAHLAALWIRDVGSGGLARCISRLLSWLPARVRDRFRPGYFTPGDPPQFYEGHAKSTLLGLITFGFYLLGFFLLNPEFHASTSGGALRKVFDLCELSITPAAYVLGVAMFLLTFLSGITYFVDRFHIPLLTVLLVLTFVASRIQGTDNLFSIVLAQPTAAPAAGQERMLEQKTAAGGTVKRPPYVKPASVAEAYSARLDLLSKAQPASTTRPDTIVVCASGGGIQAAAWTVQVLTGLDEITGGRFSQRVQLISATSGGSLGALYYLDSYNLRDGGNTLHGAGVTPRPDYYEHLYRVRRAAAKSGLEEILWAFYQLDLPRSLGLSPWFHPLQDRGWAVEMGWREELKKLRAWRQEQTGRPELAPEALTLNALSYYTAQGLLPPVVFNSTTVETGRQTAFTTVTFPERRLDNDSVLHGSTFHELFRPKATGSLPEAQALGFIPDIDRTTAVRLSAAFPYISPAAHPVVQARVDPSGNLLSPKGLAVSSQHLTDGGFFDNLGILAGMEWIRTVAEKPDLAVRSGRIVILQILDREATLKGRRGVAGSRDSWHMALFGPLQTIFNVRGATQTSRTALELSMLKDLYSNRVEIEFIPLGPRAHGEEHTPPISWKLSERDLDKLRESWLLHLWENDQLKGFIQRLKAQG